MFQGVESCVDLLCLSWERSGQTAILMADNRYPVPVTLDFDFAELHGALADSGLPVSRVLPANERVALSRIYLNGGSARANPKLDFKLGAATTVADADFVYGYPFGGEEARRVTQTSEGAITHTGELRHAIDFAMPEGTPVLAARAGVVVAVRDGAGRGSLHPGQRDRGNAVIVAHDDQTLATYGHLSKGIPVALGQRVARGERIADSGDSGFSSGPHLHFHVGLHTGPGPGTTIPLRFRGEAQPALGAWVGPGEPASGP